MVFSSHLLFPGSRSQTHVTRDQTQLFPDFPDRDGDGATFHTNMETAQLRKSHLGFSRPWWRRSDFRDQGSYGATQEMARLKKQRRDWPGQRDQKLLSQPTGDGAKFQTEAETARARINSSRPWVQSGDGATFQTKAETARLSSLKLSARLCNLDLNPDAARPSNSGHEAGPSTRVLFFLEENLENYHHFIKELIND